MPNSIIRLGVFAVGVFAALVTAQAARGQERPQVPKEDLNTRATLEAAQGNLLKVTDEEGTPWLIKLEAKPADVLFTAQADAQWLKPGMWIRFSCELNRKAETVAPVDSLMVLTPRDGLPMGIVPQEQQNLAAAKLFESDEEPQPAKRAKPKRNQTYPVVVFGRIAGVKKDELKVVASGRLVKVDLAESPTIDVELASLQFARPGDTAELRGWYYPNLKGRAVVTRVKVSAKEPLTGKKKLPLAN